MKNTLKEITAAYFKYFSNICLAEKLSTLAQNFLRAWKANLESPKSFMGTKSAEIIQKYL
jgi:hypothetical protein